ncbi:MULTISPECIES: hypothetical protein [Aeromonas]|uniref:hypothetical protein n=1 Tax=Aeromonas TaxID=642 RepID=UPI00111697D8|nr:MULTISPECIES: hypothetical protein [Aeromonas]MBJ7583832.1 hypothetical protein [Aeromonas veronii]MBJ7592892.1 hypothetical protein [Aeromonas veronii]QWZ78370.1 hypothetical protein I6L49_05235 [Aeromonas sp. FDAARGOS 1419]QWZ78380.1 hypothetical protein I6L49_05290 [Aeromonas sp. FDAARGOS 1419]TNI98484.1 hypothetical protein CF114_09745 [Aeromonas veronii]
MKIRNLVKFAPAAVAVALSSGSANAAGLDFSAITGFVTGEAVLAGVAAVVGIQIAPTAGKWAFRKVMAMFGR